MQKILLVNKSATCNEIPQRRQYLKIVLKKGYSSRFIILVVKCKFWQQTIYIMINVQYKKE